MMTTDQATKLVDAFADIAVTAATAGKERTNRALEKAKEEMVAALTGSSRIDRPAVDPNTETQMAEAITPDATRQKELIEGKLLMLDDLLIRHRQLHETLVHYVGCTPDKLHIRTRDLLFTVVDVGMLMRIAGGPWREVLERIEADQREIQARTKFAARSTENLAPEILKAKTKAAADAAEAKPAEGQPDGSNG
jgi:hypothetical protein